MRRRRQSTIKQDLYEYDLDGYDMDAPLVLQNRTVLLDSRPPSRRGVPPRTMPPLGPLPEGDEDPLGPHLFVAHHKRCEKDEKRIMESDRLRLVSGADRIFEQQRSLRGPYWQREIASIVQIDNLQNIQELRTKRKLALEEIALFVRRFNAMESERKLRQRSYTEPTKRKPPRPKRKSMHVPAPEKPVRDPKVWIYIPRRAFGVCMPQLSFRPQVFTLPRSWRPAPLLPHSPQSPHLPPADSPTPDS